MEHTIWIECTVAESAPAAGLPSDSGKCFHNPQCAVMQMSMSTSSSVVPAVPEGPSDQDVLYRTAELQPVMFQAINSANAAQTVNCQVINSLSTLLWLPLSSYRPHLQIIGHTRVKVLSLIIPRIMRFELFLHANR